MEHNIRVDQSHCNYRLSLHLSGAGWEVLFRDPGRVSRGSSGTQQILLSIFEKNAWPIPDIVAIKEGKLLLVEIDYRLQATEGSIERYRLFKDQLLRQISTELNLPALNLLIGFLKIGAVKKSRESLEASDLDMYGWFDEPLTPTVIFRS